MTAISTTPEEQNILQGRAVGFTDILGEVEDERDFKLKCHVWKGAGHEEVYWMLIMYQALGWVSSNGLLHLVLTMPRNEYNNQNFIDVKTEA